MRLRHITGAEQRIAESEFVVSAPEAYRGHWAEVFGNDQPIRVEIGMGKGKFIMELARRNPQINYLGAEVAKYLKKKLAGETAHSGKTDNTQYRYYVSDDIAGFEQLGGIFLEREINGQVTKIDIEKY